MLNFLRGQRDADFISPYDHMDCYRLHLHRGPKWLAVFENHHWRTAASTCLTFLTRKSALARYERVFRSFSRPGGDDCALWLSLTKHRVLNPVAVFGYLARREFYWKSLVKAWLFCWPQIVFGRRAKLWVPVPGVGTHLSAGLLSPGVNWPGIMWNLAHSLNKPEPNIPTETPEIGVTPNLRFLSASGSNH